MEAPRVLVLGHSGTEGFGLEGRANAWPGLVEQQLRAMGTGCTVVAVPLFPVGSGAVSYAAGQIERHQPDIVILSVNAYPCAIAVVSARVRRRMGNRAHRLFTRFEKTVRKASNANAGPVRRRLHRSGRRIAHALIGREPLATVDEVAGAYSEILRDLARQEGIQVLALYEAPFSAATRRELPNAYGTALELQRRLAPVIAEHRFVPLTPDGFENGGPAEFWMPDGVHLSAAGNQSYAASVTRALKAALGVGELPTGAP